MPVCLGARQVKVSMITLKRLFLIVLIAAAGACKPDLSDDEIPYVPFPTIIVNLGLPENFHLQTVGTHKLINEGGVRGIILYHHSNGYYAFERNCSYHPNEAGATVEIDATGLRMRDPSCGSVFDFEGRVISGPAWRPLRKYVTTITGNQISITDEVLN